MTASEQQAEVYEIDVPMVDGKPPLNHNQRLHWRKKAELTRLVRDGIAWRAKAMRIGECQHITVQLHYAPGNKRRRDPANFMGTSKPAIDGLVDAGIVRDDTADYVTEQVPKIHTGKTAFPMLWLTVTVEAR